MVPPISTTGSSFRGSYYRDLGGALSRARAGDEHAIEPELAIVDPHHHLFSSRRGDYLLPDFLGDLASGHCVEQTVFIDSGASYRASGAAELRPVGETEFVVAETRFARKPEVAAAIVGHIDLDLGERVEEVATVHINAGEGRFRGVRDLVQWDASEIGRFSSRQPPPGRMGSATFREGLRRIGTMSLSFDLWIFHPQLGEAAALASACPDTILIVDHLAMPLGVGPYEDRRADVFHAWRKGLLLLAERPNVRLKIGGLGMPYAGFVHHLPDRAPLSAALAEAWRPYIETACAIFGAERCMFESNYPADGQTCGYGTLWNAFKQLSAGWSSDERAMLFSGTARATYRLNPPLTGRGVARNGISQNADAGNLDLDHVTCFHVRRGSFGSHPDHIAGLEGCIFADRADEVFDAKQHFRCLEARFFVAIEADNCLGGAEVEIGFDPRADSIKAVGILGPPGSAIAFLPAPFGDIVPDRIAKYVIERIRAPNMLTGLAYDYDQLALVMDFFGGVVRDANRGTVAHQAPWCPIADCGLGRHRLGRIGLAAGIMGRVDEVILARGKKGAGNKRDGERHIAKEMNGARTRPWAEGVIVDLRNTIAFDDAMPNALCHAVADEAHP
jgi:predicted TIM-barrel fold metal-dependent hydrolase